MANFANSTLVPERPLLRDVAALDRLLPASTASHDARGEAERHDIMTVARPSIVPGGNDKPATAWKRRAAAPIASGKTVLPGGARGVVSGNEASERGWLSSELSHRNPQNGRMREQELLAILDAGPISIDALTFMGDQRRKKALLSIEALIDLLDALEPDPDLEETGDAEPTMGRRETGSGGQGAEVASLVIDECEIDDDLEPSLGSLGGCVSAGHFDQRLWGAGSRQDQEQDVHDEPHDGGCGDYEPDLGSLEGLEDQRNWAAHCHEDGEPSLGSPENPHDQRHWSQGEKGSREGDHSEWTCFGALGWQHREALDRIRRKTEDVLRRKRLAKFHGSNVVILSPGVAQFWGAR